jgi:hypothetical protein
LRATEEAKLFFNMEISQCNRAAHAALQILKFAVLESNLQLQLKAEILVWSLYEAENLNFNKTFILGGPMTVTENGTPTLIGVHIQRVFGTGFNYMKSTRVSRYLKFISENAGIPLR